VVNDETVVWHADGAPSPTGGRWGLLGAASWSDLRGHLRSPEFAVGVVALPLVLYLLFGVPNTSVLPTGATIRTAMLVSIGCYGAVTLAIFTLGEGVARDRGRGWTRALAVTPMPGWVQLAARLISAGLLSLVVAAGLATVASTLGDVDLAITTWLAFGATMLGGTLAFSSLGFAIAHLVRPRAAAVVCNLIFMPMAFVSGFFVPLGEQSAVIRDIARVLPSFHFGQLAYRLVLSPRDVQEFTGLPADRVVLHLAWVIGSSVLFGVVGLLAARREDGSWLT
jgi:ABC-2 type transport system permease protein